ncbi:MAG: hypothetical protein V1898_00140 [Patescibacteria group bacterium]
MKKKLILFFTIAVVIIIAEIIGFYLIINFYNRTNDNQPYSTIPITEITADSEDGYSFIPQPIQENSAEQLLKDIAQDEKSLSYQAEPIAMFNQGQHAFTSSGVEIFTVDEKQYFLKKKNLKDDIYQVYDGDTLLFEKRMCWPQDQASGTPELFSMNNKLAVKFFECDQEKNDAETTTSGNYSSNIYYDGQFINQKFNVINAKFIFIYNGKLGFIAQQKESDYIFYKGLLHSNAYDNIYTENCCAQQKLVPTLFDNGVLLFYGHKNSRPIITELKL